MQRDEYIQLDINNTTVRAIFDNLMIAWQVPEAVISEVLSLAARGEVLATFAVCPGGCHLAILAFPQTVVRAISLALTGEWDYLGDGAFGMKFSRPNGPAACAKGAN